MLALQNHKTALVRWLLDQPGLDPALTDRAGRTALHTAATFATPLDIVIRQGSGKHIEFLDAQQLYILGFRCPKVLYNSFCFGFISVDANE